VLVGFNEKKVLPPDEAAEVVGGEVGLDEEGGENCIKR